MGIGGEGEVNLRDRQVRKLAVDSQYLSGGYLTC